MFPSLLFSVSPPLSSHYVTISSACLRGLVRDAPPLLPALEVLIPQASTGSRNLHCSQAATAWMRCGLTATWQEKRNTAPCCELLECSQSLYFEYLALEQLRCDKNSRKMTLKNVSLEKGTIYIRN